MFPLKAQNAMCPQLPRNPWGVGIRIDPNVSAAIMQRPNWLATSTAVPLDLDSNPVEDMDVCKCIVPSMHGGILNSRQATSPLVRLVEVEERWEAPDHSQKVLPQNWGETELNRSVTSMVLKATANDRRHLALCRSGGSSNNNNRVKSKTLTKIQIDTKMHFHLF
ncbi:uncharacterized protein TNCV_1156321 [Trichonephila clavipes]|nr:uncharacterized protein TNCV_1156321 [Trichonephila clavipes]